MTLYCSRTATTSALMTLDSPHALQQTFSAIIRAGADVSCLTYKEGGAISFTMSVKTDSVLITHLEELEGEVETRVTVPTVRGDTLTAVHLGPAVRTLLTTQPSGNEDRLVSVLLQPLSSRAQATQWRVTGLNSLLDAILAGQDDGNAVLITYITHRLISSAQGTESKRLAAELSAVLSDYLADNLT